MSDQLNNIRAAYRVLENRVVSALRTQLGDQPRLSSHLVHMRIQPYHKTIRIFTLLRSVRSVR